MTNAKFIHYLKTILSNDRPAWFIIKLKDAVKLELLKKKIVSNQPYNIKNYGELLYAGYETKAPQEVLEQINESFGTDFSN